MADRINFVTGYAISRDEATGVWFVAINRAIVNRLAIGDPLKLDLRQYGGTDAICVVFSEEFHHEPGKSD